MSLGKKVLITILLTTLISTPTPAADIPQGARAIAVSGGEEHTVVLTAAHTVWGCGENGYYQLGIGNNERQKTLAEVLKGDMNSPSLYLEDITAIDAGWMHSLALDPDSETLFLTYERSEIIEMVNAQTMVFQQNGLLPGKPRIFTGFSDFSIQKVKIVINIRALADGIYMERLIRRWVLD